MFNERKLQEISKEQQRWETTKVPNWIERHPERKNEFSTVSGVQVKRLYTPEDIRHFDYVKDSWFTCHNVSWPLVDYAAIQRFRYC
jgi:methylmalonyl-CoA mutase N-terminal domain/subunit